YEAKVSPGAAERLEEFAPLLEGDIPPAARQIVARWNDGKFAKLGRSDEAFLAELLAGPERSLEAVKAARHLIAGIHHLPFAELLPPPRVPQWDFAKAYAGSAKIGQLLLRYANIRHVL